MVKEINVTYETLFEFLMREKSREELQKLDSNYSENLRIYLLEKKRIALAMPSKLDYFSIQEKEKTEKQLQNIFKILREFYDRREKKIISLAVIKSRTGSDVIDTSAMTELEGQMFQSLCDVLGKYRAELLINLINARPDEPNPIMHKMQQVPSEAVKPAKDHESGPEQDEAGEDTQLIRFVHSVPKFLGKNLEVYGPFEEEDIASLPSEIAGILVRKGRAEILGGT